MVRPFVLLIKTFFCCFNFDIIIIIIILLVNDTVISICCRSHNLNKWDLHDDLSHIVNYASKRVVPDEVNVTAF